MIQASTEADFKAYIQTKDNRINNSTGISVWKHLWKFTNDMSGEVHYVYPAESILDRYTQATFTHNATPNMYGGQVNLELAGYWKYQVFEVTWITAGETFSGNMPPTEEFLFDPAADSLGVVEGEVTKGKMYLEAKSSEIKYTQNAKSVQTLTIMSGGTGYTTAPTITIDTGTITQATATCTISGGAVNTVTITNAGSGYTENPTVHLAGGGPDAEAVIIADINETNYIYTG